MSKKLKIALCLSGQPRSYKQGYEYIKHNLLDQYDVDVYYHTWDGGPIDYDELWNLYKPMRCQVDPPTKHGTFDHLTNITYTDNNDQPCSSHDRTEYWRKRIPADSTVSQFYSIMMANALSFMSGIQYDWVVKMRFDYALNIVIPFYEMDDTRIHISSHVEHLSDHIAWSSQRLMMTYSSTFNSLLPAFDDGVWMIAEEVLGYHLWRMGVRDRIWKVETNDIFPPKPGDAAWSSIIRDDLKGWLRHPEILDGDFPEELGDPDDPNFDSSHDRTEYWRKRIPADSIG